MIAQTPSLNSHLTPSSASTLRSWVVVFTASLFFFYEFVEMNMFNAINPALISEFKVTAAELGQLSANYFYGNVVFLFPAGILLDRFSTRNIILAALLLSVVATFVFAFTSNFTVAELCRFATGIAGSFCFLSCVRLASRWFPPSRMALIIGLVVTVAMLGGVVAQTPLTWLTDHFNWRYALLITGALGIIFLLLVFTLVQDFPAGSEDVRAQQHAHLNDLGLGMALKRVLMNKQNWLGGLYTSLLNLPIFLIGGLWGSLYLVQAHGLTRIQASWVTSMIFFGTIIGSPVLGWFSDRIGFRRTPMLGCGILALAVVLIIMYAPGLGLYSLMGLIFLLGFFTSAQIISYPLIAESNPLALTGTAESIASILIMSGGMLQPFFGWLMDLNWNHAVIDQIPVYSVENYRLAMSIIPIAFIIGLIAAGFIRETYCRAGD